MFISPKSINNGKTAGHFDGERLVCFQDHQKNRKGNFQVYDCGPFNGLGFILLNNAFRGWRQEGITIKDPNNFLQFKFKSTNDRDSVVKAMKKVKDLMDLKLKYPATDIKNLAIPVAKLMN